MSAILVEITVVLLLILLNGVFAMSELAIVSARKTRLQQLANNGDKGAQAALELAQAPNHFLSTVQIGITLVGVLAGAFGGATLATVSSETLARVSWLAPYADALGLGLVVVLIAYCSLVIGELVPKRLALQNPEGIAIAVARPMNRLARAAFVIVRFLSASTNVIVRLLGIPPTNDPTVTREDIRLLMQEGTRAGVFHASEQDMVESVFRLVDRHVNALMTPHTELVWLDITDPLPANIQKIMSGGYSGYPVCENGLDNLIGVVRTKDVLAATLANQPVDIRATMRQPVFVPENATASRLVDVFQHTKEHMLLVIDEHGGIQGIVTEHDMLEGIVGNIPSLGEGDTPGFFHRPDGSWLIDGLMLIDDLKDVLDINITLPDEGTGNYQTVGGFVMHRLGDIPTTGTLFEWEGLCFEVLDMDERRVDKVLVTDKTGACHQSSDDSPGQPTGPA
ncbi:MAG: HlyC/CorC family transporter [Anaerolineae bacterium]|nr:HlyC/CorC family transporter [Anaerolineae bacterium]